MGSYEEQQKHIEKLWADFLAEEESENFEFQATGSDEDSDHLSVSDHQSASEQSADEDLQIQEPAAEIPFPSTSAPRKAHCFGKDQTTMWFWHSDYTAGKRKKKTS